MTDAPPLTAKEQWRTSLAFTPYGEEPIGNCTVKLSGSKLYYPVMVVASPHRFLLQGDLLLGTCRGEGRHQIYGITARGQTVDGYWASVGAVDTRHPLPRELNWDVVSLSLPHDKFLDKKLSDLEIERYLLKERSRLLGRFEKEKPVFKTGRPLDESEATAAAIIEALKDFDKSRFMQCLLTDKGLARAHEPDSGKTILHLACEKGYGQFVAEILKSKGFNHRKDQSGHTPIDYAFKGVLLGDTRHLGKQVDYLRCVELLRLRAKHLRTMRLHKDKSAEVYESALQDIQRWQDSAEYREALSKIERAKHMRKPQKKKMADME